MRILALDIGKNKSVYVDYLAGSGEQAYGKVATRATEVHDLLVKLQPQVLVLECGPDAGWICDLAAALQIPAKVANTNDERWSWKKSKNKNDRRDALKLGQMTEMNCLPTVHVPDAKVRQWRSLIEYRHGLVDRRTAIKNSIRGIFQRQGEHLPGRHKAWSPAAIEQWRQQARPLSECSPLELWRGQLHEELEQLDAIEKNIDAVEAKLDELARTDERVQRLQSAPAVGPRVSERVVAMLDDPHRFSSGRQVGAYAGLAPRQWQSGQKCVQGHISRWGDPLLRELLVEASWTGIRCNAWMRQVYEDVRRGSDKRKKVAIVAVARRLLVRLWAMLRDGTTWKEPAVRAESQETAAVAEAVAA